MGVEIVRYINLLFYRILNCEWRRSKIEYLLLMLKESGEQIIGEFLLTLQRIEIRRCFSEGWVVIYWRKFVMKRLLSVLFFYEIPAVSSFFFHRSAVISGKFSVKILTRIEMTTVCTLCRVSIMSGQ